MVKLNCLIDKEQIATKIQSIAEVLNREYEDKDLVLLMVLKGAICLAADLIRAIKIPCDLEVVQCKSYGQRGQERGDLEIVGLDQLQIDHRDVLIIDDIFDSGHTLSTLIYALQRRNLNSLRSLVLLSKKVPRVTSLKPDYVLFHIENRFVIGYGLDYKERYRGLSGVYIMEEGP